MGVKYTFSNLLNAYCNATSKLACPTGDPLFILIFLTASIITPLLNDVACTNSGKHLGPRRPVCPSAWRLVSENYKVRWSYSIVSLIMVISFTEFLWNSTFNQNITLTVATWKKSSSPNVFSSFCTVSAIR